MNRIFTFALLLCAVVPASAQGVLTLDSCRALALRNNKQLNASRLKQEVATNIRKAARTKYLPKIDAIGGYQYFSRQISLLSGAQQDEISNLGTSMAGAGAQAFGSLGADLQSKLSSGISSYLTGLVQQGVIDPATAQKIGQQVSGIGTQIGTQIGNELGNTVGNSIAQYGNQTGKKIVDALHTDTRNIWAGAILVRQPIFMGGAIAAMNRIAEIGENIALNDLDFKQQSTLYSIDQAYWMVVSLKQKQKLAYSYRNLIKKLDKDVHKMIKEGVATKAQGLKVDVKVNEAEMQCTQVDDGLTLSKMLLCQLTGLPMDSKITLADEDIEHLDIKASNVTSNTDSAYTTRPEIRMLQNAVDISEQNTKIVRAAYLPHIALTGGYLISNPNVFNGFQRKFDGTWNVGVTVQVPVWNWMEGAYKVRAGKAATAIARMELNDLQEKIHLQVNQSQFKLSEAKKRLRMAEKNTKSAEENLRCANLGFKEGVMGVTEVMAAQTAWQQAQSQKIDAQIDLQLSQVGLQKALGTLY